jgi:hypothetical protein
MAKENEPTSKDDNGPASPGRRDVLKGIFAAPILAPLIPEIAKGIIIAAPAVVEAPIPIPAAPAPSLAEAPAAEETIAALAPEAQNFTSALKTVIASRAALKKFLRSRGWQDYLTIRPHLSAPEKDTKQKLKDVTIAQYRQLL